MTMTMTTSRSHRIRIGAFTCVLLVIAAAGGVGLMFALRAPVATAHVDRSEFAGEWAPAAPSSSAKMRQIAGFVQARYLTPGSKKQLSDVMFRELRVDGKPVKTFAIVHVASGQQERFDPHQTAVFSVCGSAADCSIPGKDTLLGALAERQALETALRSFRADDSLQLVLVQMPVSMAQVGRMAVYFRRADLSRALERPLRATLPLNPPPTSEYANAAEKKALATLVVNYAFNQQTKATVQQRAFVLFPVREVQAASQAMGG
jgi:hypothetical protein